MDDDVEGELILNSRNTPLKSYISSLLLDEPEALPINLDIPGNAGKDNQKRRNFITLNVLKRVLESEFKYYNRSEGHKGIKYRAWDHINANRHEFPVSIEEHIFITHPFQVFFFDQDKYTSGKQQAQLSTYLDELFTLLDVAKIIPQVKVTVLDKPELYHVGTSHLLSQGLIDDVILTESNTGIPLKDVYRGKKAQSFYELYDTNVFVAGTYRGTELSDLVHSLHTDNVSGPQYNQLTYLKNLIVDVSTPQITGLSSYFKHILFPPKPKEFEGITSSLYISHRSNMTTTKDVISLETLPDDVSITSSA